VNGEIVMNYTDAQNAHRDLFSRERALRTGVSIETRTPYSDLVTLDAGHVDGQNLILDVSRAGNRPLLLFRMWLRLDLAFAGC
jgi:hypothetical protein